VNIFDRLKAEEKFSGFPELGGSAVKLLSFLNGSLLRVLETLFFLLTFGLAVEYFKQCHDAQRKDGGITLFM
jgi:hypothetical protein